MSYREGRPPKSLEQIKQELDRHEEGAEPYLGSFTEGGSDLLTEEDLDDMEKSTVLVNIDKPVVLIPFAWTCTASRRRMFHAIATLEKTYKDHGGIGAVLLEQAIHIAMGLALYSNPAPNQKLTITIGLDPQINGEANVFVKCEQKAIRLPPGFSSVRELEIFEAQQAREERQSSNGQG